MITSAKRAVARPISIMIGAIGFHAAALERIWHLVFWSDDSVQGVVSNTDLALKVRRVAQTKITDYFKN